MKLNELNEGVAAVKIRTIKKQGKESVVYDGDPGGYEWNPSQIKNNFEKINALLGKLGRRFDRLIITKWSNTRYFLGVSRGTPEVVYYFYYDAYGHNTYVYIDWLKVKTKDFLALSQDEQLKLLSTTNQPDPAAIWKKERSIEVIAAALESIDKSEADKVLDTLGSKFLAAIDKFECDSVSIHKLAEFIRSLDKIGTVTTKKFADRAIETFKNRIMISLLTEVKEMRFSPIYIIKQIALLRKSGLKWPELDAIDKSIHSEAIKYILKDIKSGNFNRQNLLNLIGNLKQYGYNWPELDTIEKSLKIGSK